MFPIRRTRDLAGPVPLPLERVEGVKACGSVGVSVRATQRCCAFAVYQAAGRDVDWYADIFLILRFRANALGDPVQQSTSIPRNPNYWYPVFGA